MSRRMDYKQKGNNVARECEFYHHCFLAEPEPYMLVLISRTSILLPTRLRRTASLPSQNIYPLLPRPEHTSLSAGSHDPRGIIDDICSCRAAAEQLDSFPIPSP